MQKKKREPPRRGGQRGGSALATRGVGAKETRRKIGGLAEQRRGTKNGHIFFKHKERSPFRNLFNYKTTL